MTKHSPQIETLILGLFADGRSLQSACRESGVSRSAFLKWMHADPDLRRRYEETQFFHAQALVDDCMAIAEDPFVDLGEGPCYPGPDMAAALRQARFRMEVRLKVANLYFKRHEAALARQAREAESRVAAEAEAALMEPVREALAPIRVAGPAVPHPMGIAPSPLSPRAPAQAGAQGNRTHRL